MALPAPGHASRPAAVVRALLVLLLLALGSAAFAPPWAALWLGVPVATAASLLLAWRFGPWAFAVPLSAAAWVVVDSAAPWSGWIMAAGVTGAWMGLREEGGGPSSGERGLMLAPLLLLAAIVPLLPGWTGAVNALVAFVREADKQSLTLMRESGWPAEQVRSFETIIRDGEAAMSRTMPHVLPVLLFLWTSVLVSAGRSLAARTATLLGWPTLGSAPLCDWRLPDVALAPLLVGLALWLFAPSRFSPCATALVAGTLAGFCVQGVAVVESALLSRGVPLALIVLTLLFMFVAAWPAFVTTATLLGLSDVWRDYRRLEPAAAE